MLRFVKASVGIACGMRTAGRVRVDGGANDAAIPLPSFRRTDLSSWELRESTRTLDPLVLAGLSGCVVDNPGTGDGAVQGCAADYGTTLAAQQPGDLRRRRRHLSTTGAPYDATSGRSAPPSRRTSAPRRATSSRWAQETPTAAACRAAAASDGVPGAAGRGDGDGVAPGGSAAVHGGRRRLLRCVATGDATYRPGSVQLQCEGGELRGRARARAPAPAPPPPRRARGPVRGRARARTGTRQGACEGAPARPATPPATATARCMGTCTGTCLRGLHGLVHRALRGGGLRALRGRVPGHVQRPSPSRAAPAHRAADGQRRLPRLVRHPRPRATAQCTPGQASLRRRRGVGRLRARPSARPHARLCTTA